MISTLTFRCLKFCIKYNYVLGHSHFRISTFQKISKNQFPIIPFSHLSFLICLSYLIFLIYRILNAYFHAKQNGTPFPFEYLIQMIYFLASYSLPPCYKLVMILRGHVLPIFIVQYLDYFQNIRKTYSRTGTQGKDFTVKCNRFLFANFLVGVLVNFQNCLVLLKKPDRPQFFTSVISHGTPIFLKLFLVICQLWVWLSTWTAVYFYSSTIYTYTSCGLLLLRELK